MPMLSEVVRYFAEANRYFNAKLAAYFRALDGGDSGAVFFVLMLSFGYGVVHALGPGHGKALVAGYLLANPHKRSHVVQLGFFIALTHAFSALCVTALATYVIKISTMRLFKDVNPPLFKISGVLILLMGLWLLFDVWRSRKIKDEAIMPQKSRFGVVLLAGVLPCPGVITLLFFAISLKHIWLGVIAAVVMSFGMGITISLAGLLASSIQKRGVVKNSKWVYLVRILGVLCVIALGLFMLLNPISTRPF